MNDSFNGATAMKPWKRWSRALCPRAPNCFNGATAMKPWKRMRGSIRRSAHACFNGATAMKPWKRCIHLGGQLGNHRLQWGHGDEAVEESNLADLLF